MPVMIDVEVVLATAERQVLLPMQVAEGATVADVISESRMHVEFPEVTIDELDVGVWGRLVDRDHVIRDGDRIEIYRPLGIDPREARRRLASAGRTMGRPARSGSNL